MSFENYFPLWNDLNTAQKKLISDNLITQHVKKGTIIHNGDMDCTGLWSTHISELCHTSIGLWNLLYGKQQRIVDRNSYSTHGRYRCDRI